MKSEYIINEIGCTMVTPIECVSCGSVQSPIDIATQAVQDPGAGMHYCQVCKPISVSDRAPETFK